MIELNKETFEREVIKSNIPVLVDFWAPWCGPCKMVAPVLEKISSEFTNKLKFTKLNVDDNQEIAVKHDVRGIPCMVIFKGSKEIDRIVGSFPEAELRKKIDSTLAK